MTAKNSQARALPDLHHPLRVMFVLTFMPVGGAETLLVNLIRRMDRRRFTPEICCLKFLGPLGEELAAEVPAFGGLLRNKYDVLVLGRLTRLMRERQVDAVITVGTGGDKMFWGRWAAARAGVPVIASALHSTGHPDHVERMNRFLTPWTDAFIAVAEPHGQYITDHEGCPADKVWVIPNGVDTDRFAPRLATDALRVELRLAPEHRVTAIVAALRAEKQHELFLRAAARVHAQLPEARFLVVGDGPRRAELTALAQDLGLGDAVRFLGTRGDVDRLLSVIDVVTLTSKMEANPVSLLEALAAGRPVVAPRVGSIPNTVPDNVAGLLCPEGDEQAFANAWLRLLGDRSLAQQMGQAGRQLVVEQHSLAGMVEGYQRLIETIYRRKRGGHSGDTATTIPSPEPQSRRGSPWTEEANDQHVTEHPAIPPV